MLQLFLLFSQSLSWCPFFHQYVSRQFSYDYFPYITDKQREAFIIGSIYADGFDKSLTHNVPRLRALVNQLDPESELYWFFMGNYAHISPDMFAHAGKSHSFIVSHGIKHHLSELIIDSLFVNKYDLQYLTISSSLKKSLEEMGIQTVKTFNLYYPIISLVAKLPLYKLLPKIQNDGCPAGGIDLSICNFMNHYSGMLQCMKMAFPRFSLNSFTDQRLREMSISILFDIECCVPDMSNQTLVDNYDPLPLYPNSIQYSF